MSSNAIGEVSAVILDEAKAVVDTVVTEVIAKTSSRHVSFDQKLTDQGFSLEVMDVVQTNKIVATTGSKKIQLPPISNPTEVAHGPDNDILVDDALDSKKTEDGPKSVRLTPLSAHEHQSPSSESAAKDEVIRDMAGKLAAMEMRLEALETTISRPVTAEAYQPRPQLLPRRQEETDGSLDAPETASLPETSARVFDELIKRSREYCNSQSNSNTVSPDKMTNNLGPGGTEMSNAEVIAMLQREHQRVVAENQKLYGLVRGKATTTAVEFKESAEADNEIQFYNDQQQVTVSLSPLQQKDKKPRTAPAGKTRTHSNSGSGMSSPTSPGGRRLSSPKRRPGSPGPRVSSPAMAIPCSPSGRMSSPNRRPGSPGPRVGSPIARPQTTGSSIASTTVIVSPLLGLDPLYEKQSLLREQKWVGNFAAQNTVLRHASTLQTDSYREPNKSTVRRTSPLQERGKGPVLYLAGMAATSAMAKEMLDEYTNQPSPGNRPRSPSKGSPDKKAFDLSPSKFSPKGKDKGQKIPLSPVATRPKTVGVGGSGGSGGGLAKRPQQQQSSESRLKSKSVNTSPSKSANRKLFHNHGGDALRLEVTGMPSHALDAPLSVVSDITEMNEPNFVDAEFNQPVVDNTPLTYDQNQGEKKEKHQDYTKISKEKLVSGSSVASIQSTPSPGKRNHGHAHSHEHTHHHGHHHSPSPEGRWAGHGPGGLNSPSRSHSPGASHCTTPHHEHAAYVHAGEDENLIREHLVHDAYFDDTQESAWDKEKIEKLAHKLKMDSKANDYIHLHHFDVEVEHEKLAAMRTLGDEISVAHIDAAKAPKIGQTVLVGKQLKGYMHANAKLAIYRGRALVSGSKEFRERPITKSESALFNSPYAQPREQTFMQRVDIAGSERILQEDLLSKGKEAHSSAAFKARMGYNPPKSTTGSVRSGGSVASELHSMTDSAGFA